MPWQIVLCTWRVAVQRMFGLLLKNPKKMVHIIILVRKKDPFSEHFISCIRSGCTGECPGDLHYQE